MLNAREQCWPFGTLAKCQSNASVLRLGLLGPGNKCRSYPRQSANGAGCSSNTPQNADKNADKKSDKNANTDDNDNNDVVNQSDENNKFIRNLIYEENEISDLNKDKLSLDTLLSRFDGIGNYAGLIIIGTTNNKNNIDPALYRDGRLSLVEFNYASIHQRYLLTTVHCGKEKKTHVEDL